MPERYLLTGADCASLLDQISKEMDNMDAENKAAATDAATSPEQASGSIRDRVATIIEDHINPAVAMHGGFVELVDVKDSKVFVALGGGCQGCAASSMTLRMGIETMIMEEIPEVTEVIDATDHSAGTNPYYTG